MRHSARYWRIAPRVYPRGVFRVRSIAEAQAAREHVADESAGGRGRPLTATRLIATLERLAQAARANPWSCWSAVAVVDGGAGAAPPAAAPASGCRRRPPGI